MMKKCTLLDSSLSWGQFEECVDGVLMKLSRAVLKHIYFQNAMEAMCKQRCM